MQQKKITKSGGITIPRIIRQELGIHPGTPVEVELNGECLSIRKHVPTCVFCGSVDDVKDVEHLEICVQCAQKIGDKYGKNQ